MSNIRQVPSHQVKVIVSTFISALIKILFSIQSVTSMRKRHISVSFSYVCIYRYNFGVLKEVFVDPARDDSLVFELLDLKLDVPDNGSATWFLQDLAAEQDAQGFMVTPTSLSFLWGIND